jgi:GDP-4-dehydro-6-deoxy-D-mannose reductase
VRVLVTGGGGFVGRRLGPRLERDGWELFSRDQELDVTDAGALGDALAAVRPDAIVHLAAQSSVAASLESATRTFRVNYLGTHHLLAAAARVVPETRFLFVSSGEVYGAAPPDAGPFDESAPLRPGSPYARSKASGDRLAADFAGRGLDVVRVRPFNHTGPGQTPVFAAPSFARQIAEIAHGKREPRLQVGNLDSIRDFLDVEDVVDAYARLLQRAVPAGVYNVASGTGRRIGEVLEGLLRHAGVDATVETDPARVRPTDHSVGDASRIETATGWTPRVPFDTTLARLFDSWLERVRAA